MAFIRCALGTQKRQRHHVFRWYPDNFRVLFAIVSIEQNIRGDVTWKVHMINIPHTNIEICFLFSISIASNPLMNLLVFDQVRLLPERLGAHVATERFFSSVGPIEREKQSKTA